MRKPKDQHNEDEQQDKPEATRSEEALRVVEEYVNSLREVIKKLRRFLN